MQSKALFQEILLCVIEARSPQANVVCDNGMALVSPDTPKRYLMIRITDSVLPDYR